ncbi:MAG: hypothetical protein ACFFCS_20150 [Candidatus Hodarchaeota archaeon]
MDERNRGSYRIFKGISTKIYKISYAFLIMFNIIYFIITSLVALAKSLIPPWEALFEVLFGLGFVGLFIFFYAIAHTRFGALFNVLGFAYWWVLPCNWVINEWDKLQYDFAPTYFIMWGIWFFLGGVALHGIITFLLETINLGINRRSWLLGPWFPGVWSKGSKTIGRKQKIAVKKTLIALGLVLGGVTVSVATYLDLFTFEIEITPKDYDITYNFWATPNINGTYSAEVQATYGFGPYYYTNESLDQFNKHKVNLDLTFNRIYNSSVNMLIQWETRCPDITYRITIYPLGELATVPDLVRNATEILMACESNGTLDQWKGFAFDIEGIPFRYNTSFDSYQEATEMWDDLFDYIDEKSAERGKTIEMECISDMFTAVDFPFDGDADIQIERGFNAYIPERFTTYAPMIYRCWYGEDKPFGSEMDPEDPWDTSYSVYAELYSLKASIPDEKLGFYIGITNTSCYGRDLPQPEPYTWPEGTNTGFTNLMRDVLIAKHFGMDEITFFLAWSWPENEYAMGGVFESYGDDFLDQVNQTVNEDPPERFTIFYKQSDAFGGDQFRTDWLYDMSKPIGILEIGGLWAAAIFIVLVLPILRKKKEQEKLK